MANRLTPRMKRQLHEAERRGYLSGGRIAKRTYEAWYGLCMSRSQPFMMVTAKARNARIIVDLAPAGSYLTKAGQRSTIQLFRRRASPKSRGMVGSYTVLMEHLPAEHTLKTARVLWLILQEHAEPDALLRWIPRSEPRL